MNTRQVMLGANKVKIPFFNDEEYAEYLKSRGGRIKRYNGIYWMETKLGFLETTHWLKRVDEKDVKLPSRRYMGYRYAVHDEVGNNNGFLPVHILRNFEDYDLNSLGKKKRNLKSCRAKVNIVRLDDPAVLMVQGYRVLVSKLDRTGYQNPPSKRLYNNAILEIFSLQGDIVLAGMIGENLGGYLLGKIIDDIAYIDELVIETESLSTNVATGLVFDFVQICKQLGNIKEIVAGLHTPEDENLNEFKKRMLFSVAKIPVMVNIHPVIGYFYKRWRPSVYYRLTGEMN